MACLIVLFAYTFLIVQVHVDGSAAPTTAEPTTANAVELTAEELATTEPTIEEPTTVKIVASCDIPSTYNLSPPSYRAASPLSITCEVQGLDDYSGLFYQWQSNCSGGCFVQPGVGIENMVSTPYLHSYDTGVHTCVVHSGSGILGSANISVNVVGAGIFVPSGSRVLSNNSLITTLSVLKFIPSFHCLSGSAQPNVGNLIGPLGNDITLSTTGPLTVARGGLSDPGTLSVHSASPLGLHDIGIYTYRTPDENGDVIDFHFGLYYSSNSVSLLPFLLDMDYTHIEDLHTLTCVSNGSPPTQMMWERNGESIYQNDTNGQFSQILVERTSSTYNNTLTINGTIEDVVGEYSCTVSNTFGTSNKLAKTFQALELSSHHITLYVGGSMDINCSTHLEVTKMEWLLVGVAEPAEQSEDGGQNLTLVLDPTDTELDGATYTCMVTTKAGNVFQDSFVLEVKGIVHNVSVDGAANPVPAGDKYTLTCNVTAEFAHSVKWLDSNNTEIDDPDIAIVIVSDDNTTSLLLHFDPLKTSHAGTYTCVSSISEPTSIKMATRNLLVQITSDSTTVTRYPAADTLFASNELNITCVTSVNQAVDTPVQVTHQWDGPGGVVSTNSLVSVSSVTRSGQDYSSTVFFSSLVSSHSGTYTCSSTVNTTEALVIASAAETASTSFNATLNVTIRIIYSSPGTYPVYSPPNYRAASAVTLQCVVSGYSGSISYHWTSTCSSCFASNEHSQNISDTSLKNFDAGVHTCSVTDGLGNTGSNSTTMRIVGIGIDVWHAHSTHILGPDPRGIQPSNSFAISQNNAGSWGVRLSCCSNSTNSNVGSFTFPNGVVHSSDYGSWLHGTWVIEKYSDRVRLQYRNSATSGTLRPDAIGIYTCTRPDSEGNLLQENIGLYNEGFNAPPFISQVHLLVQYSANSSDSIVLVCHTHNSPPTIINWYRDDKLIDLSHNSIDMSVSVTNRHTSSFEITLTMACDLSDNMVESYTCDVSNRLGGDTQTYTIEGLQIQCDRSEFVIGETVTCNCSSEIEHSTVNWREQDLTNPEQAGDGVPSVVSLTVGPVTTDSQGEVFTCLMNSSCVAQEKTLTVDVIIPDEWATVDIQNSTGENALNNTDYILTCTVTVVEGITLPITVEWVGPDGDVVTSEGNRMVGEVEVQRTVSTLSLSFIPVFSSDGGSYTCRAAISVPWVGSDPAQLQATVDMPVTSQAVLRLRIYPGLPLCINWSTAGAADLEAHVKSYVEKAVRERCNCAFSSSAIYSGQFSCVFGSSESECDLATYVTYRAVLNGTSDLLPADQVMGHIQDWRETRGTLIYNVFHLRLASNAECAVSVNSLEDAEC